MAVASNCRNYLRCGAIESLRRKVDRISDRLTLLDNKVALDFMAMREDLQDVRNLVRASTTAAQPHTSDVRHAIGELDSFKPDMHALQKAMESCYSSEHALLTAFHEEKRRRIELEEKLKELRTEVFDDFKSKVNDLLENKQRNRVSFSARAFRIEDIDPWDTVMFPDVVNNGGGVFNKTSGTFIVPISGTYVFYCNILTKERSYIELALQVNEISKLLVYSGGENNFGVGSNLLVIDLKEGDIVKVVKYGPWGTRPYYIHNTWSTFSGFLLFKS